MMHGPNNDQAAFFDSIADKWDGWEDLAALGAKLAAGLVELGISPNEKIVDIGCGTGNLTKALLDALSPTGKVVAVDISPGMLDVARRKITDSRVEWRCEDALRLSAADSSFDRVFCYSVWPHFRCKKTAAMEFSRMLRPGGRLHIWHLIPRSKVNEIHAGTGEAVRHDILTSGAETAQLLARMGFTVDAVIDNDERYLVTAIRQKG